MITDANDVVQTVTYNGFGLPEEVVEDVGGLNATTQMSYDGALNLLNILDANGNSTHYQYTPHNEVAAEHYADDTSVAYVYDPRGSVNVLTLQDGQAITHTHDALGRKVGGCGAPRRGDAELCL